MPHLAKAQSPQAVALAVRQFHQRHRFLAAVHVPGIAGPGPIYVYGSDVSCTDALIQATCDHPGCERFGEYEYLPNSVISEMLKQQISQDPVSGGFKRLGLIKP